MAFDPGMRGLSLDQAPPLSIPFSFFFTAPLMLAAGGALVAVESATVFTTRWAPSAAAAVHFGTLGCLAMTMFGALYQMLPVVAGAPVPAVRLAHVVHALLVAGALSLVAGLAWQVPGAFTIAGALLSLAFVCFLVPAGFAAARAKVKLDTVPGMRLVMPALITVVALGVEMALARGGIGFVGDLQRRHLAHVGLGLVCWVGGLIVPISWQVVPMFYLTEPYPRWARLSALLMLGGTTLATLIVLFATSAPPRALALALLPGAIAVWAIHPAITVARIRKRRRKRVGESVRFWLFALTIAPLVLASAIAGVLLDDPRWVTLFGWLALVGWATVIVHGMLTRIVPFLIWFHRYSRVVGQPGVPSMRELLPDARARIGLVLHAGTAVIGAIAILAQVRALAVVAGLGLVATGVAMLVTFARALRTRTGAV
jgi:hypothetical protein